MASLFLIPTSLNPETPSAALLAPEQDKIKHLQNFIVETAKIGRMHLKQLNLNTPLQQLNVMELNKHKHDYSALIKPLQDGHDVGLISDCGCPAVADPGSRIISIAHQMGFNVVPLVGPSSILLALMASGMNGQNFSFIGYLPAEPNLRKTKLQKLEQSILKEKVTYIFIEAPFRNQKLAEAIIGQLNPELKLCIAINLMTENQQILSYSIQEWRCKKLDIDKKEVIFLIGQ